MTEGERKKKKEDGVYLPKIQPVARVPGTRGRETRVSEGTPVHPLLHPLVAWHSLALLCNTLARSLLPDTWQLLPR